MRLLATRRQSGRIEQGPSGPGRPVARPEHRDVAFFQYRQLRSGDLINVTIQNLSRLGAAGVALFAVSVVVMHAVQPELSPNDMAISYYLNGRLGGVLSAGLISLGIGSLSLAVALRRRLSDTGAGAGVWLLGLWGVGCIIGGVFPPDPPGHWDEPPSVAGMIHGGAAMVAFVAFPIAAWLLSRKVTTLAQRSIAHRPLALLCACALVVFFVCLAPAFANRPPYALGLVERILVALYAAWLVAVSGSIGARTGRAS